jgi:hypothetical protein
VKRQAICEGNVIAHISACKDYETFASEPLLYLGERDIIVYESSFHPSNIKLDPL